MKISIQNYLTVVVALVLVTVEAAPAAELSDKYPSFSLSEVLDKKGLYFTKQIPRFLNKFEGSCCTYDFKARCNWNYFQILCSLHFSCEQ